MTDQEKDEEILKELDFPIYISLIGNYYSVEKLERQSTAGFPLISMKVTCHDETKIFAQWSDRDEFTSSDGNMIFSDRQFAAAQRLSKYKGSECSIF